MTYEAALADYTSFDFNDGRWTRKVYRRGAGPAVIIMQEMPGLHPLVIRFADRVAAAGMTVFMPVLFGEPGRPVTTGYAIREMLVGICIRREFKVWATDQSSPIIDWLRGLAKKVHAECGGRGVGAVGMCFTGGFALAMMTEPSVVAPVLSQPSLPLTFGSKKRAAGMKVCCGGIVGMGESRADRAGMIAALACLPSHPESVPINLLVRVSGTPLAETQALDGLEFVRSVAAARICMPASVVRLSAGREGMSDELQALCFLAGANSIFCGARLLTTPNPGRDQDRALMDKLGLLPMAAS